MTKCMNDPALATMIRLWNGCWRYVPASSAGSISSRFDMPGIFT